MFGVIDILDLIDFRPNPRHGMKAFVHPKAPLKDRVSISFSGGKTSAYMTKMLLDYFRRHEPWREVVVTFANTGQEHEETLKFVERCDREFGFGVVWLEASVYHGIRKSSGYRIVNFETASRNGEPFEDVIKKYGLPNKSYNHCTRETKLNPMKAYYADLGWSYGSYSIAVGIRSDEMDRMSETSREKGVFYPCVDAGVRKTDIANWWECQPFNLGIPEHFGNCVTCWKKSLRKLLTISQTNPEFFEFFHRMERDHALSGGNRRDGGEREPRVMFRENNTVESLFERAKHPFEPFIDGRFTDAALPEFDMDLDLGGGCGESCEVYADLLE